MKLATVTLSLALSVPLAAQVTSELEVNAYMDIYRAGGFNDGSNGIAPAEYAFAPSQGKRIVFDSVTGTWTCGREEGAPYNGPDGVLEGGSNGCHPESISPIGTFAGYYNTDFGGALVGMFLEDQLPLGPRPNLRFYFSDSSQGGIKTDFNAFAPFIAEVFFIGDGLTGTGTGNLQIFVVPPTATHLYLGYVDGCAVGLNASPGCYSDNGGALTATFSLYTPN